MKKFLSYFANNKSLSPKTIKAYSIDLEQYGVFSSGCFDKDCLLKYIASLQEKYKPKTVKRKIACLKAFSSYLIL
ncbi:MAG: site-specific integrase [Eubacterium sp.]|nr:site-specific integrase [Eubacterium sp.]